MEYVMNVMINKLQDELAEDLHVKPPSEGLNFLGNSMVWYLLGDFPVVQNLIKY